MSPKATVVGVRNRVGDAEGDFSKISPALLPEKKVNLLFLKKAARGGTFFEYERAPYYLRVGHF